MTTKLAFVLGGGGSRGALQIGSLNALLEYGLQPDLLVGTSIGAVNAAFLSLNGFTQQSLDHLKVIWEQAAALDLLPFNYVQSTLRAMLGRSPINPSQRIQEFFIQNGISPDLYFSDIQHPQLIIVSSDLKTGKPILHGDDPGEKILESLLLSTALPPWTMPVKRQSGYLMDGGVLSNLPIEPALRMGATHIAALDLLDSRELFGEGNRFGYFLERLTFAVQKRQVDLELGLAEARGVPVLYMDLVGEDPIPLWDFHHTDDLIARGYELTKLALTRENLKGFKPDDRSRH